jgi:hypothetical protein
MKLVLLLAFTLGACTFTSHNVNVGQVPHAAMPFATAAPASGVADLTAGGSVPTIGPSSTDDNSGAEVPAAQVRGEARIRITDDLFIGTMYEQGVGHASVNDRLPAVKSGHVYGFGAMFGGSFATAGSNVSIGWTVTAMRWTIPYDKYSMVNVDLAGHPIGVANEQSSDTGATTTFGLGIWPSWRSGQLRVFGGGYLTQRPTVHLFTTDTTYIDPLVIHTDSEDVVGHEAVDAVLGAGVEYAYERLSLTAMISQEVVRSVMRTGPSVQFAVSVRLGERASDRKRPSSPPPPPSPIAPPSAIY